MLLYNLATQGTKHKGHIRNGLNWVSITILHTIVWRLLCTEHLGLQHKTLLNYLLFFDSFPFAKHTDWILLTPHSSVRPLVDRLFITALPNISPCTGVQVFMPPPPCRSWYELLFAIQLLPTWAICGWQVHCSWCEWGEAMLHIPSLSCVH